MTASIDFASPGAEALDWLTATVAALKDGDALAPVTIVPPNMAAGRLAVRHIAAQGGYVNLNVARLADLATSLARPLLGNLRPLTPVLELAAARAAAGEVAALRPLAHHLALAQALVSLFRELRRREIEPDWHAAGAMAQAAGEAYGHFRQLTAGYLDATSVRRLALEALDSPSRPGVEALDSPSRPGVEALDSPSRPGVEALDSPSRPGVEALDSPPRPSAEGSGEPSRPAVEALGAPSRPGVEALDSASALPVGALVLYLPTHLDSADIALLAALAHRVPVRALFATFDDPPANSRPVHEACRLAQALNLDAPSRPPQVTASERPAVGVIRAPDQREEVREVVRQVLAGMESGVPLHRMAILYRQPEAYASLVADTLDAAGLPWCSLSGAKLIDSRPGQALLDLLRLPQRSFAREAVLRVVSALPWAEGRPSAAMWDRVSREANIVRGADQWVTRLTTYAQAEHDRWKTYHAPTEEEPEPRPPAYIESAREMAAVVQQLQALLRPPADGSPWQEFVDWAETASQAMCGNAEPWPRDERPNATAVRNALAMLAEAGDIEAHTSLAVFLGSLEQSLSDAGRPAGQLGQGILLGPIQAVAGMAFDRVFVIGLTEGAFPPAPPTNPFFPTDTEDVLSLRAQFRQRDREAFFTAMAAAPQVTLSTSQAADGRAAFPSRWLLEVAAALAPGSRPTASTFATLQPSEHPWLRALRSPQDAFLSSSTAAASPALSLDERRLAQAIAWRHAGHSLRSHPLAHRPDLPLQRGLAMAQARRSRRLTPFDGNVSQLAAGLAAIARLFDQQRAMSATGLESWAKCPFSFFLERVLHVRASDIPEDRWTIDAAVRGTLIHQILEEFLSGLAAAEPPLGTRPYTEQDRQLLRAIADRRFADLQASGLAGNPLIWEATAADVWADLEMFLQEDQAWRADQGWQPARFEQRFGFDDDSSWPALEMEAAGLKLRFRGQIDRIDVASNGARAQLYDYKTGRPGNYTDLPTDPVIAGRALQLALYSEVVQRNMSATNVGATYWFVSSRGSFAMEGLTKPAGEVRARLDEVLGHIATGIGQGLFPAVPGDEKEFYNTFENCGFCAYERICPTGRDQQWAHKQDDPVAQRFVTLSLPGAKS